MLTYWLEKGAGSMVMTSKSTNLYVNARKKNKTQAIVPFTQVGSPAVRLRLAHCTAWVKRWSEAMDFKLFSKQISPYRESLRIILYHPPSHLLPKAFHHSLTWWKSSGCLWASHQPPKYTNKSYPESQVVQKLKKLYA